MIGYRGGEGTDEHLETGKERRTAYNWKGTTHYELERVARKSRNG